MQARERTNFAEDECIKYLSTCTVTYLKMLRGLLESPALTLLVGVIGIFMIGYIATLGRERVLQVINKIIYGFPLNRDMI